MAYMIDGLQYANWSEKIFKEMRTGAVDAVHVTITYHENFRETVHNIERWNRWFEQYPDLIFHGRTAAWNGQFEFVFLDNLTFLCYCG